MSVCHPDWRDSAACKGIGHAIFYSDTGADRATAIALCQSCPVQPDCLQDALNTERGINWATHGYRAGHTANARIILGRNQQHQRRQAAARCGTDAGYHRHRYIGEPACDACLEAHAAYVATKKNLRAAGERPELTHDTQLNRIAMRPDLLNDEGDAA